MILNEKKKKSILLLELLLSFNTGQVTAVVMFCLSSSQRLPEYLIYEWLGMGFDVLCGLFVWLLFIFFKHSHTKNIKFIPAGQHSNEKLPFKDMKKMRQIKKA